MSARMQKEIRCIEQSSDKYISPDSYYVIKITCPHEISKDLTEWGKSVMIDDKTHRPVVIYSFENGEKAQLLMLYSCLESGTSDEHYLSGAYSKIISLYSSTVSRTLNTFTNVSIIEFSSRTQILAYFLLLSHKNSKESMIRFSQGAITQAHIRDYTHSEVLEMLQSEGVDWEKLHPSTRYGTFYKLKKRKKKIHIISISSEVDHREQSSISEFIFGV